MHVYRLSSDRLETRSVCFATEEGKEGNAAECGAIMGLISDNLAIAN